MEYIHIKNLEKYQPKYKDGRRLLWIRWDIDALSDYKLTKLLPEQKWLFIGLICLEVKAKREIPWDENWVSEQLGFKKNHIHKHLIMLQTLELIIKVCNDHCESLSPTIHTIHNNTIHTNNTEQTIQIDSTQADGLLKQFTPTLQEKITVYIERNRLKNKSKVITEGRKVTLLNELWNTRERCANDDMFGKAVDAAISYAAENIGYINAVIKNKKAGK